MTRKRLGADIILDIGKNALIGFVSNGGEYHLISGKSRINEILRLSYQNRTKSEVVRL